MLNGIRSWKASIFSWVLYRAILNILVLLQCKHDLKVFHDADWIENSITNIAKAAKNPLSSMFVITTRNSETFTGVSSIGRQNAMLAIRPQSIPSCTSSSQLATRTSSWDLQNVSARWNQRRNDWKDARTPSWCFSLHSSRMLHYTLPYLHLPHRPHSLWSSYKASQMDL